MERNEFTQKLEQITQLFNDNTQGWFFVAVPSNSEDDHPEIYWENKFVIRLTTSVGIRSAIDDIPCIYARLDGDHSQFKFSVAAPKQDGRYVDWNTWKVYPENTEVDGYSLQRVGNQIRISAKKSTQVVFAELKRRLVAPYIKALEIVQKYAEEREQARANSVKIINGLKKLSGNMLQTYTGDESKLSGFPIKLRGSFHGGKENYSRDISVPIYSEGELGTVELSGLTLSELEDLIRLVKEWHRAPAEKEKKAA